MSHRIKKIPYGRQWVGAEEVRAVSKVLKSDYLTQGPKIVEFESALAKIVGAKYAVAVSNGTAALHLAALALGLKPGDEVISTPMSFIATSNAVLYAGAKPVFADIDAETQCIDPAEIRKKITRRTKAIFFTDFAGHPADLKEIAKIAAQHHLKVVEDACHSLGGSYQGAPIGSCEYAAMTIFSFHPVKHITTGEGGAIVTNDEELLVRLRDLRTHGVTRDPNKLFLKNEGPWYYEMQDLGYNYRLTDMQAACGIEQLKKLKRFVARRRAIATKYYDAFRDLAGVLTPAEVRGARHAYHLYVLRLDEPLAAKRKEIFEELLRRGIGVQVHYIPIPSQPYYRQRGYRAANCPRAQAYYRSAISLPMFPKMTDAQVAFVIKTVKNAVRAYS